MILSRFNKGGSLIASLKSRLRLFSSLETVSVSVPISDNNLGVEEYRQHQLARLQGLKPSDFAPSDINQLIADFLVSAKKPDTVIAGRLLDKFIFKVPGVDEKGDLVSLYLLQLMQNGEIAVGVEFLKRLLQEHFKETSAESHVPPVTPFMMECVWKGVIDTKSDTLGFDLLKTIKSELENAKLITAEFTEQLILELFLPRLNWPAIDFIVAESAANSEIQQVTISSAVIQEIFQVLLAPAPNDPYFDPLDDEPFTGNLVNPRFHRLVQLLERWKHAGIPIKGKQISIALETTFKSFLPTESMMNELQKLA